MTTHQMKDTIKKDKQGYGLCPGCGTRITRPLNSKYIIQDSYQGEICYNCKKRRVKNILQDRR